MHALIETHMHTHSCTISHPWGQQFITRYYFINLIIDLQSLFLEKNSEESVAHVFFCGGSQTLFDFIKQREGCFILKVASRSP